MTYWNKGTEAITGYVAAEALGRHCSDDLLVHTDARGESLCDTSGCPRMLAASAAAGAVCEAELYLRHRRGHRVPVTVRTLPVRGAGGVLAGVVEIFSDNSAHVAARERIQELEQLALLDALTGDGNRRYVKSSLRARLDELERYGWPFGVLFMDLDGFKAINDRLGHAAGDDMLKMAVATMQNGLRSFDMLGRIGGDEFVAIVAHVTAGELNAVAGKLHRLIEQSRLPVGEQLLRVSVSIGAAPVSIGDTVGTWLERADGLMYRAKAAGGNRVCLPDGTACSR